RSRGRGRTVSGGADRRRLSAARQPGAAAAGSAGAGLRRRRCLPEVGGLLSRDGEIAWLLWAYRNGRGDVENLGTGRHALRAGVMAKSRECNWWGGPCRA